MCRTMAPDVGTGTTVICCVFGLNATMSPVLASLYQIRPSVPTLMPYGPALPPGVGHSRTLPVAGSSAPR